MKSSKILPGCLIGLVVYLVQIDGSQGSRFHHPSDDWWQSHDDFWSNDWWPSDDSLLEMPLKFVRGAMRDVMPKENCDKQTQTPTKENLYKDDEILNLSDEERQLQMEEEKYSKMLKEIRDRRNEIEKETELYKWRKDREELLRKQREKEQEERRSILEKRKRMMEMKRQVEEEQKKMQAEMEGLRKARDERPKPRADQRKSQGERKPHASVHPPQENHRQHLKSTPTGEVEIYSHQVQGYHPSDVKIKIQGDGVFISGSHVCSCDNACAYRQFERSFKLPRTIDTSSLSATLNQDGILMITGSYGNGPLVDREVEVIGLGIPTNPPKEVCQNKHNGLKLDKIRKVNPNNIDIAPSRKHLDDDDDDVLIETVE